MKKRVLLNEIIDVEVKVINGDFKIYIRDSEKDTEYVLKLKRCWIVWLVKVLKTLIQMESY